MPPCRFLATPLPTTYLLYSDIDIDTLSCLTIGYVTERSDAVVDSPDLLNHGRRPPCPAADAPRALHWSAAGGSTDHGYMSRKIESFERINSMRETNESFDSCKSCKRLVPSRLHELQKNVRLFLASNLSVQNFRIFSARVSGATVTALHHYHSQTTHTHWPTAPSSSRNEGITATRRSLPRKPRISSTDRQHTPDSGWSNLVTQHWHIPRRNITTHHSPVTTKPHTALLHPTPVLRSRPRPYISRHGHRTFRRAGLKAKDGFKVRRHCAVSCAERWLAETESVPRRRPARVYRLGRCLPAAAESCWRQVDGATDGSHFSSRGSNRRQGDQPTPKYSKIGKKHRILAYLILESGGVDPPSFQKCGGQDPPPPTPPPRRRRPWLKMVDGGIGVNLYTFGVALGPQ